MASGKDGQRLRFYCPACGATGRVRAESIEKNTICPKCGEKTRFEPLGEDCLRNGEPSSPDQAGEAPGSGVRPPPGNAPPVAPTSGLAIASLACGLLSLSILPLALIGIVLGIAAIIRTRKPGVGGRGMAIAGTVVSVLALATTVLVLNLAVGPRLKSFRAEAEKAACANCLRSYGMGIYMYVDDNEGDLPRSLTELDGTAYLNSGVSPTHCPSVPEEERATAYLYVQAAANMRNLSAPEVTVLACDLPGNHLGGGNALFADGSVKWIAASEEDYIRFVEAIKAGDQEVVHEYLGSSSPLDTSASTHY